MKTLVVCHKTEIDLGTLKKVLQDRNHDIDLRMGYHDTLENSDPLSHDLAIFMGGPMGVYQADIFPYLQNEINYLAKRIEADRPTLGICLGAQMIAKSQGKEVYAGKQGKEIGWHEIAVNDKGLATPLKYLDKAQTRMMQWHGDTFDLPDNATLLASSDLYKNQAYTIGKNVMALQCHPEATMDVIEVWLATGIDELEKNRMTVPALRQQSVQNTEILKKQTAHFFNEWLDQVIGVA